METEKDTLTINEVSQESKDKAVIKQEVYYPASEVCNELDTLVPKAMFYESKRFNQRLKTWMAEHNTTVDQFVMDKLHYTDYDTFCKAFAKEQVDAIASAIWNFENTGNGLIIADETGVGKGRIGAGLIRYTILELKKTPIFFTEKKHLIADIFRDLSGIMFNVSNEDYPNGIPEWVKTSKSVGAKEYTEDEIISMIKKDIADGELRVDMSFSDYSTIIDSDEFELDSIFNDDNYEMLQEIIDTYGQHLMEETEEIVYDVNLEYEKQVKQAVKKGMYLVKPFVTFPIQIKDISGNILYKVTKTDVDSVLAKGTLPKEYKVICLTYSQVSRPFDKGGRKLSAKMKFIRKHANDSVIIMDESHNASGSQTATGKQSNTSLMLSDIIENSKYTAYISATYAKRPNNMPIYALRTSIREANISKTQLINAFIRGGLPLQEATSSELVRIGQLIRREKLIQGKTEYYYESEGNNVGDNQINKLDRVAHLFQLVNDFAENVQGYFKEAKDMIIPDDDKPKYVFSGKTQRFAFLLFNFFILGLKIKQTTETAIKKLRNGKKPVIAIANTLESAFDNLKKDFINDIGYNLGDTMKNDFNGYCAYLLNYTLRYTHKKEVVDDKGNKFIKRELVLMRNSTDEISQYVMSRVKSDFLAAMKEIMEFEVGVPIAPIDVIKDVITNAGFTIEEITGRKKQLVFKKGDYSQGSIQKREVKKTEDIIRDFNENNIDCLIINQSGAVGVSMHAIPNKKVNIVTEKIPTSLLPKSEVKQRTMIITQMELDINKEVQKLGRINRTGQVYPPEFTYTISAIPSERRLTALNEKKLRSLSANVSSNQEQSSDLFSADDFFSNLAVPSFNETTSELGWNDKVSTKEEIYDFTKSLYFTPYNHQKSFYDTFSKKFNTFIADLKAKGLYTGALAIKDYSAVKKQILPFIIGDNNASSSFGRHTFIELCEVTVFDEKILEYDIENSITTYLAVDEGGEGKIVFKNKEEFAKYWINRNTKFLKEINEAIDVNIKSEEEDVAEYNSLIETYKEKAKQFDQLPEAIELQTSITTKSAEALSLSTEVGKFAMEGKMEEMNVAALKLQELNKELAILKQKFHDNPNFEYVLSKKGEQDDIMWNIKDNEKSIEKINKRITSYIGTKTLQAEIVQKINYYAANVGMVFNYREFDEEKLDDHELETPVETPKYSYRKSKDSPVVLVGIKVEAYGGEQLSLGRVMLKFSDVSKSIEKSLSPFYKKMDEEDISAGRKHLIEIEPTGNTYKGWWNSYVSGVNTGKTTEKMFLTGSLLKAFSTVTTSGLQGTIIKYNTDDNKIKTAVELDAESQREMTKVFNEDSSEPYSVYFDITRDNYNRLILNPFIEKSKADSEDRGMGDEMVNATSEGIYNQVTVDKRDIFIHTRLEGEYYADAITKVEITTRDFVMAEAFASYANEAGIPFMYKNGTGREIKSKSVPNTPILSYGLPRLYEGRFRDKKNIWFSNILDKVTFVETGWIEMKYSIEFELADFYKLLDAMKLRGEVIGSVTGSDILEMSKDYYIFEQFADEINDVTIDDQGNGDISSPMSPEDEASMDEMIDELVKLLSVA